MFGQRECDYFEWTDEDALGTEANIVSILLNQLHMKEKKILKLEKKNGKLKAENKSLKCMKKFMIWLCLMGLFVMYTGVEIKLVLL